MAAPKAKVAWGVGTEILDVKRGGLWHGLRKDVEADAAMRLEVLRPAQEKREQEVETRRQWFRDTAEAVEKRCRERTKKERVAAEEQMMMRGKEELARLYAAEKELKLHIPGQERAALKAKVEAEAKARTDYAREKRGVTAGALALKESVEAEAHARAEADSFAYEKVVKSQLHRYPEEEGMASLKAWVEASATTRTEKSMASSGFLKERAEAKSKSKTRNKDPVDHFVREKRDARELLTDAAERPRPDNEAARIAEEEEARAAAERRVEKEEEDRVAAEEQVNRRRERERLAQLAEAEADQKRRQESEEREHLAAEEKERKRLEKAEKDRIAAEEAEKRRLEKAEKELRAKEGSLLDRLSRKHLHSLPTDDYEDDEDWEMGYDSPAMSDCDGGRRRPSPGLTMTVIHAALEAALMAKMSRHAALANAGLEHMSHLDDDEVADELDFEDV